MYVINTSLVKWRLTDWIKITRSNPNSCASLEDSGTRGWPGAAALNRMGTSCASR